MIAQIYDLVLNNKIDDAIDLVYDNIDKLLSEGEFTECDLLLDSIDINKLDIHLMRAILCITKSAKLKLHGRHRLLEPALQKFMAKYGEATGSKLLESVA